MASSTDLILQGAGQLAGGLGSHFDKQRAAADRNRPIHPAIEEMIRTLGPKKAAIMLRLNGGMPDGAAGGAAQPAGSKAAISEGKALGDYGTSPGPAQGLGAIQPTEEESPDPYGGRMTTRDLEDYQKAAPFVNAARERTSQRDFMAEIAARGEQARQTEGVKTEGRKAIQTQRDEGMGGRQDKELDDRLEARRQRHEEFKYKMKQDWESLQLKLSEAKDRLRIDHGDAVAIEILKQTGADLRSAESNLKGYRTSLPQLAADPGMDEEADRVSAALPELRSRYEELVGSLKHNIKSQGSTTKTSGGASVSGPQGSPAMQSAKERAKALLLKR